MKKALFLFCLSAIGLTTAQISIAESEFPTIGDMGTYYIVDSSYSMMEGITGSGVTWDFSGIGGYNVAKNSAYLTPGSSSFGSNFSNADQMWETEGYMDISQYFSMGSLYSKGFGFTSDLGDFLLVLDDSVKLFDFPLEFGNTPISGNHTGELTEPITQQPQIASGSYTALIDGDGTLMLPNGNSFNNVLRTTIYDSVRANVFFQDVDVIRTERTYYQDAANQIPLFITVNFRIVVAGNMLRDDNILLSIVNPSGTASVSQPELMNVSLYPNPSTTMTKLSGDNLTGATIEVLDLSGRVAFSTKASSNEVAIKTENFETGMYLVRVTRNGATWTEKLIVK